MYWYNQPIEIEK